MNRNEDELDPEDVDLDEAYTNDTRSRCKLPQILNCSLCFALLLHSSEDLDTDTEFEPVEDMALETRSRCMPFFERSYWRPSD
uniref:Uncharacterized protein n=1 Tax=Megaselia scalaris TaxID=36166 RepID=T1H4B7_MEGSC